VNAYARLHMGFLDLNGSQGRRFGSLGLGLTAPDTYIELALGQQVFDQVEPAYVTKSKQALLAHANIDEAVSIYVHREIPRHFGLGSGTQMALAIGEGINQLFNVKMGLDEIAAVTNRGKRSGIGIGTFAQGGVVLDGGRDNGTVIPPIITQQAFPDAWRVLLIFDHTHIGVHGDAETQAFANLADADLASTQSVCYKVLMQALPALKEQNLTAFGQAIAALQAYNGDYFSPVQGGCYASERVAAVLERLVDEGVNNI